jgi:alpha/beta superfamily hydrolase
MNNKIVYDLFYMFQKRGFTTLRFNFRGIGRSQGEFDHGTGELSDAACRARLGAVAASRLEERAGSPVIPSARGSACSS